MILSIDDDSNNMIRSAYESNCRIDPKPTYIIAKSLLCGFVV